VLRRVAVAIASLVLDADGRAVDASPEALDLLGVTLEELLELPPGAFAPEEPDPEARRAFRDEWERRGQPDLFGEGVIRRLDGTTIRVRFAVTTRSDGTFEALLEPADTPVERPSRVFAGGEMIAAWRDAERRLADLEPGSPEWVSVTDEIDSFRSTYQGLFGSREASTASR
jgi:PAS domain S-box-containing protein